MYRIDRLRRYYRMHTECLKRTFTERITTLAGNSYDSREALQALSGLRAGEMAAVLVLVYLALDKEKDE